MKYLLVLFSFFVFEEVTAQLKADFVADRVNGCSPLAVSFKNITTGASSAAKYEWDFGNGKTSVLKEPGTTYIEAKTYTVKLTVRDGDNIDVRTQDIIVYKKPDVDITTTALSGCAPFDLGLISTSSAGDGTITNYVWDLGDGTTKQGVQLQSIGHQFLYPQKATIKLTVTNSFGCYHSIEKKDLITIFPAVKLSVAADKQLLCSLNESIKLTSTNEETGPIKYLWDLGDGNTSEEKDPNYQYTTKGSYTPSLTITNSYGCKGTAVLPYTLNIANFSASINETNKLCNNVLNGFEATTIPAANSLTWKFSNSVQTKSGTQVFHNFLAGDHKVTLTANISGCNVVVSKDIKVNAAPILKGYVMDVSLCGAPATVNFKDTNASSVKWEWKYAKWNTPQQRSVFSNEVSPTLALDENSSYIAHLLVEDVNGCKDSIQKTFTVAPPLVSIQYTTQFSPGTNTCRNKDVKFKAIAFIPIKTYDWDLGDGVTSTLAEPAHLYDKPGIYNIKLTYVDQNDCKGTTTSQVIVFPVPKADFEAPTEVCGNSPLNIINKSTGSDLVTYRWDMGDGKTYLATVPPHRYTDLGTYTIQLIAISDICRDTLTKPYHITVLAPFNNIGQPVNTCTDDRGKISIPDNSKFATEWTWDMGDGSLPVTYNTYRPNFSYQYTASGEYKVILTVKNGIFCSVKDSIRVHILLKQKAKLSSQRSAVCQGDELMIDVNGLEKNTKAAASSVHYYNSYKWQYGDGTDFTGYSRNTGIPLFATFTDSLRKFLPGKKDLRLITVSTLFNCTDTSEVMDIVFNGPDAGVNILNNNACYPAVTKFKDASGIAHNNEITKWTWRFGDGSPDITTTVNSIEHKYKDPNVYNVKLVVEDAAGCKDSVMNVSAILLGPKADFDISPVSVIPLSPANFINRTKLYGGQTQYEWSFTYDSSKTSEGSPSKIYKNHSTDTVRLIASNVNCADTIGKVVPIRNVIAAFSYTADYVNKNNCPPLLMKFKNTSRGHASVLWDFGDGTTAQASDPDHIYTIPGTYIIKLKAFGPNNIVDSIADTILVKGPYATVKADLLQACAPAKVKFVADAKNAVTFTWDLADGTINNTADTSITHTYMTGGLYVPALIMKDAFGCAATFTIQGKILIDTITARIQLSQDLVCDSANVQMASALPSFSKQTLGLSEIYKWKINGKPVSDTTSASVSFLMNSPGKYIILLNVTSAVGCNSSDSDTIYVRSIPKASISGNKEVCPKIPLQLSGTSSIKDQVNWTWIYPAGTTNTEKLPSLIFSQPGLYPVKLILEKEGCSDSVTHTVKVNVEPDIQLSSQAKTICKGDSIQLIAKDGVKYEWKKDPSISNSSSDKPWVRPLKTTRYVVKVTNQFGCVQTDSVLIGVIQPFKIKVNNDTLICTGRSVKGKAEGAQHFAWIKGDGISNSTISDPVIVPPSTQQYVVVGSMDDGCFTDTAKFTITVAPLPAIQAPDTMRVLVGSVIHPTIPVSNDVVKWFWSPSAFLDRADVASPAITPRNDITYTIKVATKYGCSAYDTMRIVLYCSSSVVFIPNSFTPNGDGVNDVFYVRGKGIRSIKRFAIYDRLGSRVFEKLNVNIDDRSAGWDGKIAGGSLSSNVFTYVVDLICDTGETFTLNGTIMIIR